MFGTSVAYVDSGMYELQFWASKNSTGVWKLMWNAAGTSQSNSTPVTLKNAPPNLGTSIHQ